MSPYGESVGWEETRASNYVVLPPLFKDSSRGLGRFRFAWSTHSLLHPFCLAQGIREKAERNKTPQRCSVSDGPSISLPSPKL